MTSGTGLLARATSAADRTRSRLLVSAAAVAGTLLIAAAGLVRLPGGRDLADFAPFVAQPGLRAGVVAGAVLLVLPAALLGVQAVTVGSVARERWLAALRVAGATPGQRRRIAAIRTGRAGLAGGVLAGPCYLVLWFLLGWLPAPGHRLLAPLVASDLLVVAGVAGLGGLTGVLAGLATAGARRRPSTVRRSRPLVVSAAVTFGAAAVVVFAVTQGSVALALLGVLAVVGVNPYRPSIVGLAARRLERRGGAADVLAATRLTAQPRPAGRVAAVLGLCGLAFGVQGAVAAAALGRDDPAFYLTGAGLAGAATAVAALVAVTALVVAAVDQVVDARRATASLGALGADPALHRAVLRRQLTAVSLPVAVGGALAGSLLHGIEAVAVDGFTPSMAAVLLVPAMLAAIVVSGSARVAAGLAGGALRSAADPVNLRAG